MLDVLKNRLPEGLSIVSVKENNSKYRIQFAFEGETGMADLPKSCAPGCQNEVADNTVKTVMSYIYMMRGDYAKAKEWLYR